MATDELEDKQDEQSFAEPDEQSTPEAEQGNQEDSSDEETNPLALSDEEIMAMDDPADPAGESDSESDPDEFDDSSAEAKDPADNAAASDPHSGGEESAEGDDDTANAERDISAEHAKIFAPFKANGTELQLNSPEEVISLMQQGANYHQKMEKISGQMKTIKTLEKAGIDGEKLNYLIDLHNKNPQAISKLLADSEIDPMDLETEESEQYRPKDYAPSESDIALDEVLDELKETPTFGELIDVVGNQWDDSSREHLASNSELLRTLNTHMARGVYSVIQTELGRARALGQLRGLSDLAAYQQVGASIQARGGFDHLATQETATADPVQGDTITPAQAAITLRPTQKSGDQNLNAKRRAASPTKAASSSAKSSSKVNPLGMSDAEFEKQMGSILQ